MELERSCPTCGGQRVFYRAASTRLHLGTKTKWRCSDCNYGIITFNGDVAVQD